MTSNTKVGNIPVSQGCISQKQIYQAIKEQSLRTGEALEEKNLLTDYDLTCALTLKKCRIDDHGRIFAKE